MPNQDETKIDHPEKLTKRGLGRRGFLRGAGFTAAGATVLDGVKLAAKEASTNGAVVGPGRVHQTRCAAMRILYTGHHYELCRIARAQSASRFGRRKAGDKRKSMPLRHVSEGL